MSQVTVEFGAKDTGLEDAIKRLNSGLDKLEANAKKAGDSADKMGEKNKKAAKDTDTSFKSIVAAGATLAVGIKAIKTAFDIASQAISNFGEAFNFAGQMNDMSTRTGIAVGELVILERAFQNAGISGEEAQKGVNKMQRAIVDAGEGGKKTGEAFKFLKIDLDELTSKKPSEQLDLIGKAINDIEDPARRVALAVDIFGKSGANMLTIFKDGKDGIAEAGKEVGSFAQILEENAAAMDLIGDKVDAIKNKGLEFATGFMDSLLPAITDVVEELAQVDAAALGQAVGDAVNDIAIPAIENLLGSIDEIDFDQLAIELSASLSALTDGTMWDIWALHGSAAILRMGEMMQANLKGMWDEQNKVIDIGVEEGLGGIIAAAGIKLFGNDASKMNLEEHQQKKYPKWNRAPWTPDHTLSNEFTAEADFLYDKQKTDAAARIESQRQERLDRKEAARRKKVDEQFTYPTEEEKATEREEDRRWLSDREYGLERLKDLESEMSGARSSGNKKMIAELEAEQAFHKEFERYAENGRSHKEAMEAANNAFNESLDESLEKEKKVTKEKKDQLTIMEKMAEQLKAAREPEGGKRFQKIKAKFDEELAGGKLGGARGDKRIKQMEDALAEDEIRKGRPNSRMQSLTNMAKAAGIDTFGMNKDQIRDALLKQTREALKPENKGLNKEEVKAAAEAKQAAKEDPAITISKLVEKIHVLVAKIEPKLPQHALN